MKTQSRVRVWGLVCSMVVLTCLELAYGQYQTTTDIEDTIKQLADGHQGAEWDLLGAPIFETVGIEPIDTDKDFKRRNIYTLAISSTQGTEKFQIVVTATLHSREVMTHLVALAFAEYILNHKTQDGGDAWGNDPRFAKFKQMAESASIKNLIKDAEIFVVPLVNPEGYSWVRNGNNDWRKNRRDTAGDPVPAPGRFGIRHDDFKPGVDLNRNFPTKGQLEWGFDKFLVPGGDVLLGGQVRTSRYLDTHIYCGKASEAWKEDGNIVVPEVETKAVMWLCNGSWHPKPHCVIDIHSAGEYVGIPDIVSTTKNDLRPNWKTAAGAAINDDVVVKSLATETYKMIGYRLWDDYPASGDLTNWAYTEIRDKPTLSFFFEVGTVHAIENPTPDVQKAFPGILFLCFATVDEGMGQRPTAQFRKP